MHLRRLLVRNCKLMRELEVSFVRADDSPRLWTVFVGENGTCKTTLLRSIAIATAGSAFANHLVGDAKAYLDWRKEADRAEVAAELSFSAHEHSRNAYPFLPNRVASAPVVSVLARMTSAGTIEHRAHWGRPPTWFADAEDRGGGNFIINIIDLLEELRQALRTWFAAGYGTGRILAKPLAQFEDELPARDRMRSLFDPRHLPRATGFSDSLALAVGDDRARAFARCLREALVERMRTPRLNNIELRGKGGASNQMSLIEAHRFGMQVGGDELKLPAIWLSQGYQAVISLVADIIGNVWLEAGEEVALDDMEGIVLVDELDLHLHPTWQTEIVAGLKRTFPKMQFIVTTHSPLVLAGCKADEVFMLQQDDETGDVTAVQSEAAPMVMTGSELNREFFGVRRASPWSEELRRYVELASNPYRTDVEDAQARQILATLRANEIPVDYEPVARKSAS